MPAASPIGAGLPADANALKNQQPLKPPASKPRKFVFPPHPRFLSNIAENSPLNTSMMPALGTESLIHHEIDTPKMNDSLISSVYLEILEVQLFMIALIQRFTPRWIGSCLEIFHWLYQSEAIIAGVTILHFADLYGFGDITATVDFSAAMLMSEIINGILKNFLQMPRPFWVSNRIANPHSKFERDYSFPSGHSQASSSIAFGFFFAVLQSLVRAGEASIPSETFLAFQVLLLMTLLTGFSRVYLGMHYPLDVICGWIIGFCTAHFFVDRYPLGTIMKDLLLHRSSSDAYMIAFLLPFTLLIVLCLLCYLFPANEMYICRWQKIAMTTISSGSKSKKTKISPSKWQDYVSYAGIMCGALFSIALQGSLDSFVVSHKVTTNLHDSALGRLGRVCVGFLGLLPGVAVIAFASWNSKSRFVQVCKFLLLVLAYFYIGLWIVLVGPETANYVGF